MKTGVLVYVSRIKTTKSNISPIRFLTCLFFMYFCNHKTEIMNTISLKVREILKEKNIKIKDLAKTLSISCSAVSQQLSNPNPTIGWLNTIANILEVEINELFSVIPQQDTHNNLITKTYLETHCDILLANANLTKSQFAKQMGVARQNINKVLQTKNVIILQKVSTILNVPLNTLISGASTSLINGFIELNDKVYTIKTKEDLLNLIQQL